MKKQPVPSPSPAPDFGPILTNAERAERCASAVRKYSDEDPRTNLVDWLADAMHWCELNGHPFVHILDTAMMHFTAESND